MVTPSWRSTLASVCAFPALIYVVGPFLIAPSNQKAVLIDTDVQVRVAESEVTATSMIDTSDCIETILGKDGTLTPGVKYSTIVRALMDEYLVGEEEEVAWDQLESGLEAMKDSEEYGVKPSSVGPLAGATYEKLQDAILKQYFASYHGETDPWNQLLSALEVMYKLEFADNGGRPIQIEGYHIYVGSAGVAYNYQALRDTGITHIISATSGVNQRFPHAFQYMHIEGVHDDPGPENKMGPYFKTTAAFIEGAREAKGKVLVHCWEGRSRSVSILVAYLIQRGLTRDSALALIRRVRPMAKPNEQLMGELEDLERRIRIAKADNNGPLPEKTGRILDEKDSLAKGVEYSTIRRAVLDKYLPHRNNTSTSNSWDEFKAGLQSMQKAENEGRGAMPKNGSLANVSYTQLQKAVLNKFVHGTNLLQSSLLLMRRMEIDGEPVPIDEDDRRWPSRLFVGSAGAAYNFDVLKQAGITHIISIAASVGKLFPNEFTYLSLSTAHNQFKATFDFIEDAVGSGGKVFVHCLQGTDASVTILAAYLMKRKGIGRDEALAIIRGTRTKAMPNTQYLVELKEYEGLLHTTEDERLGRILDKDVEG